jgi:homoserine dehydrogenase
MPRFIPEGHYLYHVENEYNGVIVEAAFSSKQVFVGKGAGGHPTGSAVLSDISALRYGYQYEYRKTNLTNPIQYSRSQKVEIYLRFHKAADFKLLHFEEISEKHLGKDFNYVIGTVSLAHLFEIREELSRRDVFLINTGRNISSMIEEKPVVLEEIEA